MAAGLKCELTCPVLLLEGVGRACTLRLLTAAHQSLVDHGNRLMTIQKVGVRRVDIACFHPKKGA